MAPDQAAPVPAGWYPDPYGASELRWWDGQSWTESVHPPVAAEPPVPPVPPVQQVIPEPEPEPQLPVQAEPVQAEPVQAEPVQAEPVQAAPVAEPVPSTPVAEPVQEEPVQEEPVQAAPVAEPVPAEVPPTEEPLRAPDLVAPPEPTPSEGISEATQPPESLGAPLPSRRELRARTAGPSEGPLSASTSTPAPDPSAPTSFDWLNADGATPDSPTAPEASYPHSASIDTSAPTVGESAPVAASTAWAQEPRSSAADPDTLYPTTSVRRSTVSGWLIAAMPLITGILALAAVKGGENYPRYVPAGSEWWMLAGIVVAVLYIATVILAYTDRRKLEWSGFNRPAHWAWALLTAPVYLIVRTIAMKRETGKYSMTLWVWLALAAVVVGAWFAVKTFAPDFIAGYTLPFV